MDSDNDYDGGECDDIIISEIVRHGSVLTIDLLSRLIIAMSKITRTRQRGTTQNIHPKTIYAHLALI